MKTRHHLLIAISLAISLTQTATARMTTEAEKPPTIPTGSKYANLQIVSNEDMPHETTLYPLVFAYTDSALADTEYSKLRGMGWKGLYLGTNPTKDSIVIFIIAMNGITDLGDHYMKNTRSVARVFEGCITATYADATAATKIIARADAEINDYAEVCNRKLIGKTIISVFPFPGNNLWQVRFIFGFEKDEKN